MFFNMKKFFLIIISILSLALIPESQAAPQIRATLDSTRILMGRRANLEVQVVQKRGEVGTFPLLAASPNGIVGVCGDSVELTRPAHLDTLELGSGKIQVNWNISVQSFDSGFYRIPELIYVCGRDTSRTNAVSLKVVPVKATAEDEIADYSPVADADGKRWSDMLPDWLYYNWWLILILLLAIGAGVWVWLTRKKGLPVVAFKPKPAVDPAVEALARLSELKKRGLWEKGMEKEYFTLLTDILRHYLFRRFGINAMEMTSAQILDSLEKDPEIASRKEMVARILDMADFVKFARVRPLPADNVAAIEDAVSFVEATAKHDEPAQSDNSSESDGKDK